jgi:membrane dipeptidase
MTPHPPRIFDGHNDTLLNLHLEGRGGGRTFFVESSTGHIDFPRAKRGGFAGGFFAIFVPPIEAHDGSPTVPRPGTRADVPALDGAYAHEFACDVVTRLRSIERGSDGQVQVVHTVAELNTCLDQGVLAVILHFEGAEAIHPGVEVLESFYEMGLRSLGPFWSRPNIYGEGVPFRFPSSPDIGGGLTARGVALVRECNRLGVLVDLAHCNLRGFWDVAEYTDAPLVVTHGCAHALSASSRNLLDEQIDAIGESNGIVGVNFHVGFLREDGEPDADTPLETIVRHFDYFVGRIGIERVAFGSDFDGATMPASLGDVAGLPRLIEKLQRAGYDDGALELLTYKNWVRVLEATWK